MAKTAGILLIGNEILSGKITDANAAYLCRELRGLGVEVRRITVIPDEVDLIAAEVRAFSAAYDVVFTSGGVGPTHDDVTIEGVARALGVPVVREPRLVRLLESYFKGRGQLNEAAAQDGGGAGRRGADRGRGAGVPRGGGAEHLHPARRARDLPPEVRRAPASASATRRSISAACT